MAERPDFQTRNARFAALQAVSKEMGEIFRPAKEVLKVVRAVPTCFVQLDHAIGVGGFPIERYSVVHGPSNQGKSAFAIGLLKSFIQRGHFGVLIDAERTTPITWMREMMGESADSPALFADRPKTYEETVDRVRKFVTKVAELKLKSKISADTSALIVVDSLRKLVPENIFAKIQKEGASGAKGSVDGMGGRAAQIKAAMNAAWLDELIPLLEQTGTTFLAIARETEDPNADIWDRRTGEDFKIGGGKAIIYDSSLVIRVERLGFVTDKPLDKETKVNVWGEKHRVTIRKTKVAQKEGKQQVCFFHTSNGKLTPIGFDRARDVLELGERLNVISHNGGWYSYKNSKWQGKDKAALALAGSPDFLDSIEEELRDAFSVCLPIEYDEDGVISEETTPEAQAGV